MRTWIERCAEHIASATTWFVATAARVDLAFVAVDFAAGSFSLVVAWISLAAKKVTLVVVDVVLVVARVLEQCPENYQTESGYSQVGCAA